MDNDEHVDNPLKAGSPEDTSSSSRRQFMQQLSGITATSLVSLVRVRCRCLRSQ